MLKSDAFAHQPWNALALAADGDTFQPNLVSKTSRSRGRVLLIFQYCFGTGFLRARRLVRSGLLGKPYIASVETAWRRTPDYYEVPWRGEFATELGGVLLTQAIHIHDLLMDLTGPVSAVAEPPRVRRRPFGLSQAAMAGCSSMA